MSYSWDCPHCDTGYPVIIGSGFPLVYVTPEVHQTMSSECRKLHSEFGDSGCAYFHGPNWKFLFRRNGWEIGNYIWGND